MIQIRDLDESVCYLTFGPYTLVPLCRRTFAVSAMIPIPDKWVAPGHSAKSPRIYTTEEAEALAANHGFDLRKVSRLEWAISKADSKQGSSCVWNP